MSKRPYTSPDHTYRGTDIRTWQDVFADEHRRRLLSYVSDGSQSVDVETLVDHFEHVFDSATVCSESTERNTIRSWLITEHILPLEAFEVLEYDRDTETICLAEDVTVSATRHDR